jgi:hypothetical protein
MSAMAAKEVVGCELMAEISGTRVDAVREARVKADGAGMAGEPVRGVCEARGDEAVAEAALARLSCAEP